MLRLLANATSGLGDILNFDIVFFKFPPQSRPVHSSSKAVFEYCIGFGQNGNQKIIFIHHLRYRRQGAVYPGSHLNGRLNQFVRKMFLLNNASSAQDKAVFDDIFELADIAGKS